MLPDLLASLPQFASERQEGGGDLSVVRTFGTGVHPMLAAVALNLTFLAPDDWKLPSGNYPGVQTQQGYRQQLVVLLAKSKDEVFICWGYHELFHGSLDRRRPPHSGRTSAVVARRF